MILASPLGARVLTALLLVPPAQLGAAATPGARTADTIRIGRADTMDGLLHQWADTFHQLHPNVAFAIRSDTKLSAEAFDSLLRQEIDIAPFVRELFPAEVAQFKQKFGYAPTLIAVATGSYATPGGTHALAIYVHADNPLNKLDLKQLDAIYSATRRRAGSRAITTWGQLGVGGEWAALPIHAYGMQQRRDSGNPPGIVNYFTQHVMLGGAFTPAVREVLDRPGLGALDGIVQAVKADRLALGYSGFANRRDGTKTLAIADVAGGPYYVGTSDEVARRLYPLTRTVYLCINRSPHQALRPALREFIRYALSREGQDAVARDASHFLPLGARFASGQRSQIE